MGTRSARFVLILWLLMLCGGCDSPGVAAGDRETFRRGRDLVCSGRYEEAVPVLKDLIAAAPEGRLGSRAGLFLGKAYLGLHRLDEAAAAFEQTIRTHPETLEAHKCRYKLAVVDLVAGRTESALQRLREIAATPAGSPLGAEAEALARYLESRES